MAEVVIQLNKDFKLIGHPFKRNPAPGNFWSRVIAWGLIGLVKGTVTPQIMADVRRLLTDYEPHQERLTDDQVLDAIAKYVGTNEMVLEGSNLGAKVKFDDLWRNYPTYTDYPTKPDFWNLIGGNLEHEATVEDPEAWRNSCATRMSRALNYSGIEVHAKGGLAGNKPWQGSTRRGADDKQYIFRIGDLKEQFQASLGPGQKIYTRPPTPSSGPALTGKQILDTWRVPLAGKKGIIWIKADYKRATGHCTLWDGTQFVNGKTDEGDAATDEVSEVWFWPLR
jgi:hypothetical protein